MHAANALKALADPTVDDGHVAVALDFSGVFAPLADNVTIEIWHNTGDDCGPPCYYLHKFLEEMADAAQLLVPSALRAPRAPRCLSTDAVLAISVDRALGLLGKESSERGHKCCRRC